MMRSPSAASSSRSCSVVNEAVDEVLAGCDVVGLVGEDGRGVEPVTGSMWGWWAVVFVVAGSGMGCGDGGPEGYELLDASRRAAVEIVDELIEVVGPGRSVLSREETEYEDCSLPEEQPGTRMQADVGVSLEPFETVEEDRAALRRAERYLENKGFKVEIAKTLGGVSEMFGASSELVPHVSVDALSQGREPVLLIGAATVCAVVK